MLPGERRQVRQPAPTSQTFSQALAAGVGVAHRHQPQVVAVVPPARQPPVGLEPPAELVGVQVARGEAVLPQEPVVALQRWVAVEGVHRRWRKVVAVVRGCTVVVVVAVADHYTISRFISVKCFLMLAFMKCSVFKGSP